MSKSNISNEKLQANRENAKHSTGPRTDEGKRICSQNALKHGLLASQAVLPGEDAAAYDAHLRSLEQTFQPADFLEFSLLRQIVDAEWRLRRITRLETALTLRSIAGQRRLRAKSPHLFDVSGDPADYGLAPGADPQTIAELRETELLGDAMRGETARIIDTYGRHGARLLRQFERAVAQITELQKTRAAQPRPQPDPIHRRPPQSESEYTPPPPLDPRIHDIPVTLARIFHQGVGNGLFLVA